MPHCESCPIEEKLTQCCGRFPMTGERALLRLEDGRELLACPHLTPGGLCGIYATRPQGCRDFLCDASATAGNSLMGGY